MNNDQEGSTGDPVTDRETLYKRKNRSPEHGKVSHYDLPDQEEKRKARRKKRKTRESSMEMYDNPVYDDASLDESHGKGHRKSDSEGKHLRHQHVSPSGVEMNGVQEVATMHQSLHATSSLRKTVPIKETPHQQTNAMGRREIKVDDTVAGRSVDFPGYNSHHYQEAVQKFVTRNIEHRECKKYIRSEEKKDGTCCCGRDFNWHEGKVSLQPPNTKEKWSWEMCTRTMKARSFGTINFCGFGNDNGKPVPYIRINHEIHPENLENMWTLMHEYWHVPPPKLIISVTGGAKRLYLKKRLQESFKRGLVNAATTTGAWIVTGGTNAGVMEFVGEAVKEYQMTQGLTEQPIVALGIATWGIVDNKDVLTGDNHHGLFPTDYDAEDLNPKKRGRAALDSNHTHFILVDDGTEGKFGHEITFRTTFEQYLSEKETEVTSGQAVNIPLVLLVLEGGENTLKTAMSAIKRGTPVVVIQGSGRAADYIAKAMKDTKPSADGEETVYPEGFMERYSNLALVMFDWGRETDPVKRKESVEKCVQSLIKLLKHRSMITVFTLDDSESTNEIDQAILNALMSAKKSDLETQLNLALAWNRCDVAKKKILTVENRQEWQRSKDLLYEALFTALVQDKVDFVQLFIDSGVELKKFLTFKRLRDLYDDVVLENKFPSGSSNLVFHLLQQITLETYAGGCFKRQKLTHDQVPNLLGLIGSLIAYLMGGQQDILYQGDKYVVSDVAKPERRNKLKDTYGREMTKRRSRPTRDADFSNPARELFFWAVLLNRKQLAMMFWKAGKDHIGGALVACALLKSLAAEAEKEVEIDLSTDLMTHANLFESHSIGVLTECYSKDKENSHRLLVRQLDVWGGVTLFSIADGAELMEFMGHSCCQTKLNKIWNGKMALYTPNWKILGSMFFPPLLFSVKFHDEPVGRSDDGILQSIQDYERAQQGSSSQIVSKQDIREDEAVPPSGQDPNKHGTDKLHKVTCFGECSGNQSMGFLQAMFFYYKAPVVKFYFHTLSYLIFLALFSYMVLVDLFPWRQEDESYMVEVIVWGWAITLFIEEWRQILTKDPKSLTYKVKGYFTSVWNRYDQFVNLMFITSIVLRFTLPDSKFVWARMCYCVTLILYYLRFMQSFFVAKNLGPKVIMIKKMLTDLLFFLCILGVFILAYGVAAQALRYPNSEPSWKLIKDVVYLPYWQMYGELFLDDLQGDIGVCTSNSTLITDDLPLCPQENALVIILFAIYMIMTNVLLLNLLIAMFSYTFQDVQENSEKVWRYYRYSLFYEYFDRPTLAPPLIIINHTVRCIKWMRRKCQNDLRLSHDFKVVLDEDPNDKLTAFERVGMENYLHSKHILEREHIDVKVGTTVERIEKVIEDLESLKEQVGTSEDAHTEAVKVQTDTAKDQLDSQTTVAREEMEAMHKHVVNLDYQLQEQQQQLARALSLLQVIANSSTVQQAPVYTTDPGLPPVYPHHSQPLTHHPRQMAQSQPIAEQTGQVLYGMYPPPPPVASAVSDLSGPVAPSRLHARMSYPSIEIIDLPTDPRGGTDSQA